MSEKFRGSQVDIFAIGGSMDRDSTQQYLLRLAGSGGLQVGGSGLEVKSSGILSSMIATGAILGPHVGFTSADVPDGSTYGGAGLYVDDALNNAYADVQARVNRDGSTPMTGNLNMNGFKVSGLAVGTAINDAVTLQQMHDYVSLGMRWLYPCAYAGVGVVPPTYGCLLAGGKVRASQSLKMTALPHPGPSPAADTLTIDGAVITFTSAAQVPGDNKCTVVSGSISATMNNLVNAINSATSIVTSKGVALNAAVYAIREETAGTVIHLIWRADDATPTTANSLVTSTTASGSAFVNIDPITSIGRFYGAYDSAMDGGTIQGRRDNGVYMYDIDQADWTLIFANPGSNFFTTASGDAGAGQVNSGLNGNLYLAGGTGINTVSATSTVPPGVKITINHGDLGTNTAQFHAEESIRLNTPYYELGTTTGDYQNDFNALADAAIGGAKDTALRNVLVNGSFIADPAGPSHSYVSSVAHSLALIPGWAMYDLASHAGNDATITLDAGPVGAYPAGGTAIGATCAKIDVTNLTGSVAKLWFYQPVIGGEQFKGKKCTFRASVFGPSLAPGVTPRLFIEDSTMSSGSPTLGPAHSGLTAQYEELYVNTTIATTATWVRVGVELRAAGTYYVDAAACIFGAQYTNMPIVPRPEIEDYQLIDSMYQVVNWWSTLVNAGACNDYLVVPFGTSMMSVPVVTPTADVATFPVGITTMVITEVTTPAGRGTTRHGTTLELAVSGGVATQGDTVGGDISLDSRPT